MSDNENNGLHGKCKPNLAGEIPLKADPDPDDSYGRDPRFAGGLWVCAIILVIYAFVGASCAFGQTIRNDRGGNVVEYMGKMLALKPNARIDGVCASACTIYLARACVTPRARVMFHAAFDERTGRIDADMTLRMSKFYTPDLRKWFMANAAHLSGLDYVELSGAQAIALGARGC